MARGCGKGDEGEQRTTGDNTDEDPGKRGLGDRPDPAGGGEAGCRPHPDQDDDGAEAQEDKANGTRMTEVRRSKQHDHEVGR